MTEFYAWFTDLHLFIEACLIWLVACLANISFKLINRLIRMIKTIICGWPPDHLDADGDWKPAKENE